MIKQITLMPRPQIHAALIDAQVELILYRKYQAQPRNTLSTESTRAVRSDPSQRIEELLRSLQEVDAQEKELSNAIAQGFEVIAQYPLGRDAYGVTLVLYKPDTPADNSAEDEDRIDKPWRQYLTPEEVLRLGGIQNHYVFKEEGAPAEGSNDALLLKLIRLLEGKRPLVDADYRLKGQ